MGLFKSIKKSKQAKAFIISQNGRNDNLVVTVMALNEKPVFSFEMTDDLGRRLIHSLEKQYGRPAQKKKI